MDFADWTRALSARGLRVVPPSHPVPIAVWALRPEGGALHFRCRGTSAVLAEYADPDITLTDSASMCGCGCGNLSRLPKAPPRLGVRPGARPVRIARFDGARSLGWTGYEAGLLGVPDAAPLFERLLPVLLTAPHGAAAGRELPTMSGDRPAGVGDPVRP